MADGARLADLQLGVDPGFHVLAIRRGGRYLYRPRGQVQLEPDDELIASGPDEGHPILAELLRLAAHRGRGDTASTIRR